jgi:hypothetical protein
MGGNLRCTVENVIVHRLYVIAGHDFCASLKHFGKCLEAKSCIYLLSPYLLNPREVVRQKALDN